MPAALALLAALTTLAALDSQPARRIPLDGGWELSGEGTRIETRRGGRAIAIRTGRAVRRDVTLEDGTIEFDVEVTPYRSFVYVQFRMATDDEHEEIYFRPHKSSLPDAVQYAPVWRGESNWQLYHGAGSTAPLRFAPREWMHVRIVLRGRRAALFVGSDTKPALVMSLARDPAAGYLAFQSFTPPGGAPEGVPTAAFANVVVRPGHVPYELGPEPPAAGAAGLVTRWQLSPAFAVERGPVTELPDSLLVAKARWPAFPAEPTGVLVIGRHVARPAPQSAVVARLVLRAPADGLARLHLGYSDYVTVFVNGRPLFAADAHYSYDEPRQEGLIGRWQATVWLPLVRGDTEVLLAVADGFGGWGLTAELDPTDGAEVVSPPR
jgi:hypothetical protein